MDNNSPPNNLNQEGNPRENTPNVCQQVSTLWRKLIMHKQDLEITLYIMSIVITINLFLYLQYLSFFSSEKIVILLYRETKLHSHMYKKDR